MKLIDKDALIEKLWERRIKHHDFGGSPHSEYGHEDDEILSLINTLEMKGVDIEYIKEELDRVVKIYKLNRDFGWGTLYNVATHFFELGLKAQKREDI